MKCVSKPRATIISLATAIISNTVKSRYNGPASNGNLHITEDILWSLQKFAFNFFIVNNRNLPITDENVWSHEIC